MLEVKQRDLAAAASISLATLNNIEREVADPRSSTLASIERALKDAGIEVDDDGITEEVRLHRIARPTAYDTLFASQRVLEIIAPGSLYHIERIRFFARHPRAAGAMAPRICLLIEGRSRSILFDLVDFTIENDSRAAEVAGILLGCFAFHPGKLLYLDRVLEDTTSAELLEAVTRLKALSWKPMDHPRPFVDVFDDWEGRMLNLARRPGHPMRDLVSLLVSRQPG
jgi:hypothetical protein